MKAKRPTSRPRIIETTISSGGDHRKQLRAMNEALSKPFDLKKVERKQRKGMRAATVLVDGQPQKVYIARPPTKRSTSKRSK